MANYFGLYLRLISSALCLVSSWKVTYVCTEKPYVFNVYALRGNTHHTCVQMYVTTFTQIAQNSTVRSMLALYGSTMQVATL